MTCSSAGERFRQWECEILRVSPVTAPCVCTAAYRSISDNPPDNFILLTQFFKGRVRCGVLNSVNTLCKLPDCRKKVITCPERVACGRAGSVAATGTSQSKISAGGRGGSDCCWAVWASAYLGYWHTKPPVWHPARPLAGSTIRRRTSFLRHPWEPLPLAVAPSRRAGRVHTSLRAAVVPMAPPPGGAPDAGQSVVGASSEARAPSPDAWAAEHPCRREPCQRFAAVHAPTAADGRARAGPEVAPADAPDQWVMPRRLMRHHHSIQPPADRAVQRERAGGVLSRTELAYWRIRRLVMARGPPSSRATRRGRSSRYRCSPGWGSTARPSLQTNRVSAVMGGATTGVLCG